MESGGLSEYFYYFYLSIIVSCNRDGGLERVRVGHLPRLMKKKEPNKYPKKFFFLHCLHVWLNCEKLLFRTKKHFPRCRRASFTFSTLPYPPTVGHTHQKKKNCKSISNEFFVNQRILNKNL